MNFTNQPISVIINYFVNTIISDYVIPTIIGLAVLAFLYGIFTFIYHSDDESKRKEGSAFMFYGIIGIFIMISVWGFVRFFTGTFGVPFGIPQFKSNSQIQDTNYDPNLQAS